MGLLKPNLLIVDDSKPILTMLSNIANKIVTMTPFLAHSFAEAKELIVNNKFDVAILDLELPDAQNGEIVDFAVLKGIPSIVLTGTINPNLRDKILSKKIVDYIVKGSTEEIVNAVIMAENVTLFKGKKVLIVDDSSTSREILKDHFQELNFRVLIASTGDEAIRILETEQDIELVTVDYQMPGMNGVELIQKIRTLILKHIPIIFGVCGSGSQSTIINILKSGANDFFTKPIVKEIFNLKIANSMKILMHSEQLLISKNITQEYKKAIESSTIVTKTDKMGIITDANELFCGISGYSKDELIGKNHNMVRSPNMPKTTFEDLWRTIQSGTAWQGTIENRHKDGSSYFLKTTVTPILDKEKNITEYISIKQDISDLIQHKNLLDDLDSKNIEILKELTKTDVHLELITNTMTDAMYATDSDNKILYVNKATVELLGFEEKELIGKNPHETFFANNYYSQDNLLADKNCHMTEEFLRRKDGTLFLASLSSNKNDSASSFDLRVTIFKDVTEDKNKQDTINEQNRKIVQADSAKLIRNTLAMVSKHLLQKVIYLKSETAQYDKLCKTQIVDDVINSLNTLLPDVKQNEPFCIEDAVQEAIQASKKVYTGVGEIDITLLYLKKHIVYGNKVLFQKAVENILINSIEAIESSESVDRKISINSTTDFDNVVVMIEDSGGGIQKYYIDKLFEPYVTTKDGAIHTGLGLFLSKVYIEEYHNGSISAKNNSGSGATFLIELPCASDI